MAEGATDGLVPVDFTAGLRRRRQGHMASLPDSPAVVCDDTVVLDANSALSEFSAYPSPEALLGLPLEKLLTSDDGMSVELIRADSTVVPVRTVRWSLPGNEHLALLVIIPIEESSELGSIRARVYEERRRRTEVEQIAGIGSWELDPVTGETQWSEGHYDILGIRPGMAPAGANTLLKLVHSDDYERVAACWHGYRDTEAAIDTEYRVVRPDGAVRVISAQAAANRDHLGSVVRYTGTIRDITEQREVEAQLATQRAGLLEAQRLSRMGSWSYDPTSGRLTPSAALVELIGECPERRQHDELLRRHVHPDDHERIREQLKQLAGQPQLGTVEIEVRGAVEGAHYVLRAQAECNHDGFLVRLLGTVQDVSEQRRTETRMRRSSQRFADLVALAPVGIGIFNDADELVDANEALCGLLGYPVEALRGMTTADITHPDERGRHEQVLRAEHGVTSHTVPQRMLMRADGEPVYCELHVSTSMNDDGQRFWLVVFADVTERRRVAETLKHQATHDELTGLPNRAAIKEKLGELLVGRRDDVTVLFCDIDNFKRINDSLGHDAGDELLAALARRLRGGLPADCMAARLSADVYVVICPDAAKYGGPEALVELVSRLFRTAVPVYGQLVRVSAAIGVAIAKGAGERSEDLLRFADAAMSRAKRQGAGKVVMANAALMASADRQVHLEGQLREALTGEGLQLRYQPVVGADGRILTAEALVRWEHPERGLLSPDVFLPVAEQGDLLRELDCWVLRTALREAANWQSPDNKPVAVAVNLAGLVPGDADFIDTVAAVIAETGIDWSRVVLELVETSLVDLPSDCLRAMGILVERGVRFAVDDFGTGYSSLARLRELPAQIVKVDRRFVSGVGVDPSDFAVARAVVDMARAMGRSCVAEGVETATQFHVLRGLGVDAYQGWLFSRAVTAEDFRLYLSSGSMSVPRTR